MYASQYRGRGMGRWSTDYPRADINFMIRLSEMSTAAVNFDPDDEPIHWVVPVTDDALFGCPFIIASAVGSMVLSDDDARRLRDYLLKGGFPLGRRLLGELGMGPVGEPDRQGAAARPSTPSSTSPSSTPCSRRCSTSGRSPRSPTSASGGARAGARPERGFDSAEPHFRAILDERGRLMVAMTHNTDIQDAWEREADDPRFFESFAPDGYSLGINVLVYAMTH